jgi:hypothetical protein
MSVRIWVGRFCITDGKPQEEGPFLRSFPRQRPDEEEDELYVLVEAATPASKEHCAQLADAIGRMYRQDILSITGAVARALKSAHHQLRDWNERTLREHRAAAGVTCLAIRDRTAYVSQIGPSVAFHVGDGRFERLTPAEDAAQPLGEADLIEPLFHRYELSPGDLLLIVSPRIDELIGEDHLRSILLRGGDEALVELFRLARDEQEFGLVLLACVVEPEAAGGAAVPPIAGDREPFAAAEDADEIAGPFEEQLEPAPASVAVAEPPAGLSQPKVRLKGADADIRYRRTTGVSTPRIPPIVILGAVVVAILGLIGVLVAYPQFKESQQETYADLVSDVRSSLADALGAQDPAQKREALRQADAALIQAEAIKPGDVELAALRQQVNTELAKINAVVELPELELVIDLSQQVPGPISSRDLAIGGGGAYIVDREQPQIIAVSLLAPAPEPFVLFQSGDLVGTEAAGAPQHIAWAEDLGSLLVMDDARRLIAVRPPEQGRLLTVRAAASWGSADGIAYAGGNLYVLDRAGDQVWRYPPAEDGFDSERAPLLPTFELEQASEITVADALYLIVGETDIVRVSENTVQPFTKAGIDRDLASPGSLVPLPASNRLLVADRGNSRISVFSLDGTFLQQWTSPTSPTFSDLRAIAVDEPNNLLYMLVGGSLYRTTLPPAP